jgi:uncharacterized protein
MSARQEDLNGFIEIKGNPLSKVGIFPYLGRQISDSLIPDKIYYVYRPEEELSSEDTLNSFRLLPFTNDHAMLGPSEEGLMPAERKGVEGTIGEDVYFDFPYLKANLKIFSERLAKLIEQGKQELSIGYRCDYEPNRGQYNGNSYDFIQRNIRGNHLALVDEGRAGHDVKVLDDFKFTLDCGVPEMEENTSKEAMLDDDSDKTEESLSPAEIVSKLKELTSSYENLHKLVSKIAGAGDSKKSSDEDEPELGMSDKAKDEDLDDDDDDDEDDDYSEDKKMSDKKSGMDINDIKKSVFAEIEERDSLYKRLKPITGSFVHDGMTLNQVAEYGIKRIGIRCKKGHEQAALDGYLLGVKKSAEMSVITSDSSFKRSSSLRDYISKGNQ